MSKNKYDQDAINIWNTYVPKSGQAAYVQGELLRAIEKLRDEAHRNGNANFNEKCHGLLILYLKKRLLDENIFDLHCREKINKSLEKISLKNEPYLKDDIFDFITYRVVDWCLHYKEPMIHKNNEELYC